jgi:tetratricopeptide (TPR) repeat protein
LGFYLNEHEKAIENLKRSIEIRPTVPVYNLLTLVYFDNGDYKECIKTFESAVLIDDNNFKNERVVFPVVRAYQHIGQYEFAKKLLGLLITYKPSLQQTLEYKELIQVFAEHQKTD